MQQVWPCNYSKCIKTRNKLEVSSSVEQLKQKSRNQSCNLWNLTESYGLRYNECGVVGMATGNLRGQEVRGPPKVSA